MGKRRAILAALSGIPAFLTGCASKTTATSSMPVPPRRGNFGAASLRGRVTTAPQIVNVSHYDPKERQRSGRSYTESNVSALRQNGALGLIGRCGKGRELDTKCGSFLKAAERERMLIGSYYFVLDGVDSVWQADRFLSRLRSHRASRKITTPEVLLVGDFDSKSSTRDILRFIDRIEAKTGTLPMIYLENSAQLQSTLSRAPAAEKRRIAECPYWIALYSPKLKGRATPAQLLQQYGIWNRWVMWQYGGVKWDGRRGRSIPQYYVSGSQRAPAYFGNLDRPVERNAFNGSKDDLYRFWRQQAWKWA